ncbi:hypothetical protein [Vibrio quintilis]|uniref:N-acetyltransferase domain-containing protein n=1 Tax=Vibrio quintilis TaxID=1117707 RepID=A0A1M7YRE3_9VIBR|nr:hypothetical protein [Vibrio quintilis]SHO55202.1 hypothetical protein VQ7734_00921 [Vibrio quintilis]
MKVRDMIESDYESVVELEQKVWGREGASYEIIRSRHQIFPEGSVVVTNDDEQIVGYAAVQRVTRACNDSWYIQTDNGYITHTHNEKGHILYGIGMSGDSYGVSDLIIEYVYHKFIVSGLCYMLVLGSRVPGFASWQHRTGGNITDYIKSRRQNGYSIDPELMLYQKHGFELLFEIEDYFPCQDSLDYGALIIKR